MYDLPKVNTANTMKNDITLASEIKIKLTSNDFFNMDNLWSIDPFLRNAFLTITSVDIGIDRVIKCKTYGNVTRLIPSSEISKAIRQWITSNNIKEKLRYILTEEELNFIYSHFGLFYQIETFTDLNVIFIRI